MEELFKKQGADFTELMSGKKTKIREFWEKNKSKQRKANQSRTDATASKVESLKRQLQEKIREIRPKEEDEARATRLSEARAKCMTARTQSYCENVMALFNGRSQETDVFCKEHFDVVYHRLEPAYREREEEWREWRAAETAGLATEIQESVDRFWGFMNKQYDRTGETKSPMPKLDLLLHEEWRRSTKAMDQIAEARLTLQTKLEDAAFEAKKKFHKDIQNLEMEVVEALVAAEQKLHDTKQNKTGWDNEGNPIPEEHEEPAPAPLAAPTAAPAPAADAASSPAAAGAMGAAPQAADDDAPGQQQQQQQQQQQEPAAAAAAREDGPWDGRLSIDVDDDSVSIGSSATGLSGSSSSSSSSVSSGSGRT